MKYIFSKKFITLFIVIHLVFIVFQIYNYSCFISYSYTKQKNEKKIGELKIKKEDLMQQLYLLKDLQAIKDTAKNKLGMKEIQLRQMRQIDFHDTTI